MARKNTDGSPIGAYSCPSSQRGCAVVNELSAVQFYCPRATKLSLPVHDLPSQSFRSNGGCCPTVLRRFGHFLALTVPSAVGFAPFPSMLRPGGNPPLQHAATRRHRTQTYAILPNYGRILSQSIVLCERIRKPSIHAGLRAIFCGITGSGNAY